MQYKQFLSLVSDTNIIDERYPMRGMFIWQPYGLEFKDLVFNHITETLRQNDYAKMEFPRLIPGHILRQVTKKIDNFEKGVYWLHKKDGTDLDTFLNPTSESSVNYMLSQWVEKESDLPLKIFQEGSTFRPHNKPLPFINPDQFFNLIEAHSAHSTKKECLDELDKIKLFMRNLHDDLGIPFILLKRPLRGNKPVAESMHSFETYLPYLNRSFNIGVVYYQGQIFSKAFNTVFKTIKGLEDYTYQNTFGLSERCIGAMLTLHSDEYGLRMLPSFAPIQVAIVPLQLDNKVLNYANTIAKKLNGLRIHIDKEDKKSTQKRFGIYLKKGVPLRIGVGKKDINDRTLTISPRDTLNLQTIRIDDLESLMSNELERITKNIISLSEKKLNDRIIELTSLNKRKDVVTDNFIAKFGWCEQDVCADKLESSAYGEILGSENTSKTICLVCGTKREQNAYFSRRAPSP